MLKLDAVFKLLISSLILITNTLQAKTITCTGKVDTLAFHANTGFMLKLTSMNTHAFICNPQTEWTVAGTVYKTQPEECKMLYSMLMHAKATNANVGTVYFDGDDNLPNQCDQFPNWSRVNIRFIRY